MVIIVGTYDNFKFKCPACGEITYIQTKLFDSELKTIKIGDCLKWPIETSISETYLSIEGINNFLIILKDKCEKCNHSAIGIVNNGRLDGFIDDLLSFQLCGDIWVIEEYAFGDYDIRFIEDRRYTSKW